MYEGKNCTSKTLRISAQTLLKSQRDPSILRAQLCAAMRSYAQLVGQVISLKKLGVDDIVHFDFMEPLEDSAEESPSPHPNPLHWVLHSKVRLVRLEVLEILGIYETKYLHESESME